MYKKLFGNISVYVCRRGQRIFDVVPLKLKHGR